MNRLILSTLKVQRSKIQVLQTNMFKMSSRFQRFKEKQAQQQENVAINEQIGQKLFKKDSAYSEVQQNIGLKNFLNKCYLYTGLSIGGFLATSQLCIASGFAMSSPYVVYLGLGSLAPLIMFSMSQPTFIQDENNQIQCINSTFRTSMFCSSIVMMGAGVSPFFAMMCLGQPWLLPTSILLTSGVCAGASLYAYMKPADSLLYLKGPLMGSLFGIIGLQLAGLGAAYFGYGTGLLALSHNISLYGGLVIFTGFMAYDTHNAIQLYKEGVPDHLSVAMNLFLNFKNLLIRIMQILGNRND